MFSKRFCRFFIRFEHARFCVVFDGLFSVENFVEICCFWLLVVLIPIIFFSLVLIGESTF
jgi:hypothetical protein